jgi:hypothetical protein
MQYGSILHVVTGTMRVHASCTVRQVVYGTWQTRSSLTKRQRRQRIVSQRSSGTILQVV